VSLFTLMAMISLNLGLLNLMPIGPGRRTHLHLGSEGLRRPIQHAGQEKMLLAGFVLLLMLMVTVIYNDLMRIQWIEKFVACGSRSRSARVFWSASTAAGPIRRHRHLLHSGLRSGHRRVGAPPVQSRVFSVGNGVLWGEAETASPRPGIVDVGYGPKALATAARGSHPRCDRQRDPRERSRSGLRRWSIPRPDASSRS